MLALQIKKSLGLVPGAYPIILLTNYNNKDIYKQIKNISL